MCRYDPVTKTERRCPSYLDKASYNAKRRARYHAQKQGNSFNKTEQHNEKTQVSSTATLMEEKSFTFHKDIPIFKKSLDGLTVKPLEGTDLIASYQISDDYETVDSLNVQVREATGSFVEAKYFNSKTFQGQLDYTQLDEDSYKTFFPSVEESLVVVERENWEGKTIENTNFKRESLNITGDLDVLMNISDAEIEPMTEDEIKSLRFFSSNNYDWFNDAIYSDGSNLKQTYQSYSDPLEEKESYKIQQTSSTAKTMVGLLDSAMEKGPKVQRTLYRGVSVGSNMFGGLPPQKWVESIELGKEVVFDGYQSASQDFGVGMRYATQNGVLFEILTPEGVQISKCSEYSHEKETLLPRDTRYQVVGVHKDIINDNNHENDRLSVIQLVAVNSKGEILDGSNSDKPKPLDFSKAQN